MTIQFVETSWEKEIKSNPDVTFSVFFPISYRSVPDKIDEWMLSHSSSFFLNVCDYYYSSLGQDAIDFLLD